MHEHTATSLGCIRNRQAVDARRVAREVAWVGIGQIQRQQTGVANGIEVSRKRAAVRTNGEWPCKERSPGREGSFRPESKYVYGSSRDVDAFGQDCNTGAFVGTHQRWLL